MEQKLIALQAELKTYFDRAAEQSKAQGTVDAELRATIKKVQDQVDALDIKVAAEQSRPKSTGQPLEDKLRENADLAKLLKDHKGSVRLEFDRETMAELLAFKTVTSAGLGFSTTGVMPEERDRGIVLAPRPKLRMRDVLSSRPTNLGKVMWVTESYRPTKASPVAGNALKPSSDVTLESHSELIKTIALCATASNQVVDDYPELMGFLRGEFAERVREEEDTQILFGDATGENLNGLTTQAQAWDLTLLTASDGYEYIDMICGAMQQIAEDNENESSQFAVMHPGDWWKIRRLKDSTGRYIFGDPHSPYAPTLWGAPVVDTSIMTKGYFLVGSGAAVCAEIRDRMGVTVDISTEDGDNFRYNRVTIRAESRLALVVKRPNAFVYGAFTQSPA